MFIRFVIRALDQDSGRRQGLFQAGGELRDSGRMRIEDEERLIELQQWFRANLRTPTRFALSTKPHRKAQALSWFRDDATEQITRMREYKTLLESYGLGVDMLKEDRLGYVIYEDEHQVVAYPFAETRC